MPGTPVPIKRPSGPTCKYCRSALQICPVGNTTLDDKTFNKRADVKICPTCDTGSPPWESAAKGQAK